MQSGWISRNAANNTNSQLFCSSSLDGGNTWSPNIAISNSFNPFLGYPSQNKLGDYITVVSDNGGASVAYAATFNGERGHLLCPDRSRSWNLITTADLNNNGKPTDVLYNANTRQTGIWYLNNNVYVSAAYGPTLTAGWG